MCGGMTVVCAFETFERPSRIDEFREKLVSFKAAVGRIEVLLEIAKLSACAHVAKIGAG